MKKIALQRLLKGCLYVSVLLFAVIGRRYPYQFPVLCYRPPGRRNALGMQQPRGKISSDGICAVCSL